MAEITTELAKEFLEVNDYSVRKDTKVHKKTRQRSGEPYQTPGDIDIIAIGGYDIVITAEEFNDRR